MTMDRGRDLESWISCAGSDVACHVFLILRSGFMTRVAMKEDSLFGAGYGWDYKVREGLEGTEFRVWRGDPYDEGR
jgi:hypothetical protein